MLEKYGTVVSLGEDQPQPLLRCPHTTLAVGLPARPFPAHASHRLLTRVCPPFLVTPCHLSGPPPLPLTSESPLPAPVQGMLPDCPSPQQGYRPPYQRPGLSRSQGHCTQGQRVKEASARVSAAPHDLNHVLSGGGGACLPPHTWWEGMGMSRTLGYLGLPPLLP